MRYDAAQINAFDLTRYPDYRGDAPPDVYQLHRFGHLEEYEAEWGRRWGANGIGRLRDVALSRPTEYEVLDLWLKHPEVLPAPVLESHRPRRARPQPR